jgi:dienelactone hydrolase
LRRRDPAHTATLIREKPFSPECYLEKHYMPFCRFIALPVIASLAILNPAATGLAQGTPATPGVEITPAQCLVIKPVGRGGRSPVHTDAIERQIVLGTWKTPQAGDAVSLPDGSKPTWTPLAPNKDGVFQNGALQGGYAFVSVDASTPSVMLLEASAHNMVYVNGEPRVGDTYQTGWTRLPVQLKAGHNSLLFQCARGELRCKLSPVKSPALLDTGDLTLPDLIIGEKGPVRGAVIIVNATNAPLSNLTLQARQGTATILTPVPTLLPLSTRKIGFVMDGRIPTSNTAALDQQNAASNRQNADAAGNAPTSAPVNLTLTQKVNGRAQTMDTAAITLRIRKPNETQKRTFVSEIDGSVQYYAVNPAQDVTAPSLSSSPHGKSAPAGEAPALVLSLHGASVQALGQAEAYESKRWAHIVAPTNRRPYGFDWEDWGRLDALEVLDLAQARLQTDPRRTYLTGHSMGGHGTWNLGVTFPDRFAAIAPSAGWISFWSYAGSERPTNPTPMQAMLQRATLPSDTLALSRNYAQEGIYILHGDADDNVPVTQARTMVENLRGFHHDFVYFEQPGAGHWWDVSDEPGADCVDWAPLFDFFARRRLPADEDVRQVEFVTADPGVSATCHWAAILQQQHPLQPSRISLRYDPGLRRFVGTTGNVACLALRLDTLRPSGPLTLDIDGKKLANVALPASSSATPFSSDPFSDASATTLYLTQGANGWQVSEPLAATAKTPERGGSFKQAFRNRMLFVYGTKGTQEENAWALAKARFDAETFWYRGNGSIDIVPDSEFVAVHPVSSRAKTRFHARMAGALSDPDRSVILYGNRDTNAAWGNLLADSPIQAQRGKIQIGTRTFTGDDLSCLFVRPRRDSAIASVGVVGGTGLSGMRLTDRQAYFLSGAAYPDCLVFSSDELTQGSEGVLAAGFFGNDWSVETGEFTYRK